MLIVANGAFKSGSTWLFLITRELLPQCKPPTRYLNPHVPEPIIKRRLLADYLRHGEHRRQDVLVKSHYDLLPLRWMLLNDLQVRVLNIRRDIRDVVVSAYYHFQAQEKFTCSFDEFYWSRGRQVAGNVLNYHLIWETDSPHYLCLQYETLLDDFSREVSQLGSWLGVELGEEDLKRIQANTQLDTLRVHSGLPPARFRQGVAGDWQNHFDAAMLTDLANIERRSQSRLYQQRVKIYSVLRYWRIKGKTAIQSLRRGRTNQTL